MLPTTTHHQLGFVFLNLVDKDITKVIYSKYYKKYAYALTKENEFCVLRATQQSLNLWKMLVGQFLPSSVELMKIRAYIFFNHIWTFTLFTKIHEKCPLQQMLFMQK